MSAITGNYAPARKMYGQWAVDWLQCSDKWSSARYHLCHQLRRIRQADGRREAMEFRNYLFWLGVYPVRWRNDDGSWHRMVTPSSWN